jgi:hypothetical protein
MTSTMVKSNKTHHAIYVWLMEVQQINNKGQWDEGLGKQFTTYIIPHEIASIFIQCLWTQYGRGNTHIESHLLRFDTTNGHGCMWSQSNEPKTIFDNYQNCWFYYIYSCGATLMPC